MMKHAELIARLEAAEVGSRRIGRDVLLSLNVVEQVEKNLFYGVGNEDVWHFGDEAEREGCWSILPDPTTSLDAALALAKRVLPETGGVLSFGGQYSSVQMHVPGLPRGRAKTPELAWCIAILRALEAKA